MTKDPVKHDFPSARIQRETPRTPGRSQLSTPRTNNSPRSHVLTPKSSNRSANESPDFQQPTDIQVVKLQPRPSPRITEKSLNQLQAPSALKSNVDKKPSSARRTTIETPPKTSHSTHSTRSNSEILYDHSLSNRPQTTSSALSRQSNLDTMWSETGSTIQLQEEINYKNENQDEIQHEDADMQETEEKEFQFSENGSHDQLDDIDDELFFEALRESTAQHNEMKKSLLKSPGKNVTYPSVVKLDSTHYLREKAELRLLR